MKGFIHVVETVIVSILILLTLSQFFYFSAKQTYWEELNLELLARDILFTQSKTENNSLYFDSLKTRNAIAKILPPNIQFSVDTSGAIKPVIRIACNCTLDQRTELRDLLYELEFNNRTVVFDINRNVTIEEINNYTNVDVLFLYDYRNLSEVQSNAIIDFLEKGKGVIELSNLSGINIDTNHEIIFSIENVTNTLDGTDIIQFRNNRTKNQTNYKIWDYFSHIPAYVRTNADRDNSVLGICGGTGISKEGNLTLRSQLYKTITCTNAKEVYIDRNQNGTYDPQEGEGPFEERDTLLLPITSPNYNYTITKISEDGLFYTINIPDIYEFTNMWDSNLKVNATRPEQVVLSVNRTFCNAPGDCDRGYAALLVANDKISATDNVGRSIWIQKGNGTDWTHLLKTSISWVAGTDHELITSFSQKPGASSAEYYINYYGDIFEPAKVILTLWYVF